ncbi:peptidylprolyl isomerase [Robiginitomaculum antarcticum]|uniref:peptidylprolyl isomerase n=1 Tax=Robiginitomaculum antarcticum TaxID=437507 RepID=UPI00035E2637|nr:peptidylprolyl isomerase [Robiginitomaculum antarcticum]
MQIASANINGSMRSFLLTLSALFFAACSGNPVVQLQTDQGVIEIEVYEDKAPKSAADFLYYVDEGLYDGQGFYRVVRPDNDNLDMGMNIVQGGRLDLARLMPEVDHEPTSQTGLTHHDGAVSLARDAPDTASAAYFFVSIGENKFLDHGGTRNPDGQGYAVFGQVTKGMDIVRAIQARPTDVNGHPEMPPHQMLAQPVTIISAKRK